MAPCSAMQIRWSTFFLALRRMSWAALLCTSGEGSERFDMSSSMAALSSGEHWEPLVRFLGSSMPCTLHHSTITLRSTWLGVKFVWGNDNPVFGQVRFPLSNHFWIHERSYVCTSHTSHNSENHISQNSKSQLTQNEHSQGARAIY
jgi:hypothetical protein